MNENFFKNFFLKQYSHLLMALLSGIILIAAFPPFEQGYLAWVALIPLLATCLEVKPIRAFAAGLVFGLPLNTYVNLYLANVLFPYLPTALALTAMIGLVLYISLFYGLFALAVSLVARLRKGWLIALAIPSFWILIEYLRSLGFMGYTVGFIGYSQWQYHNLLSLTSVYGYWGLPFLILFFQSIIILALRKDLKDFNLSAMALAFVLLMAAGIFVPAVQAPVPSGKELKVLLIQGNTSPEEIIATGRKRNMLHYLALTEEAITASANIDLVIWPETVVDIRLDNVDVHPRPMFEMAERYNVPLLYGARVHEGEHLFNAITLIDEEEKDTFYHKKRLVPFVETFPMEDWLNRFLQLDLLLGSYTPGNEVTLFHVNGIPLSGIICFESYFGDHTRLFTASGGRHIFILTNDAWFNESIGLEQHAQVAAIRAAESGVGVTQVANSGITISFDYRGKELFRSAKNEIATFTKTLDLKKRETIYTRYGDYFPALWAIFLLIGIPLTLLRRATRGSP